MKDTDDVRQVCFVESGIIQAHPAGVGTWLSGFLCCLHFVFEYDANDIANDTEKQRKQLLLGNLTRSGVYVLMREWRYGHKTIMNRVSLACPSQ
jgi:hypothetical protein